MTPATEPEEDAAFLRYRIRPADNGAMWVQELDREGNAVGEPRFVPGHTPPTADDLFIDYYPPAEK